MPAAQLWGLEWKWWWWGEAVLFLLTIGTALGDRALSWVKLGPVPSTLTAWNKNDHWGPDWFPEPLNLRGLPAGSGWGSGRPQDSEFFHLLPPP